MAQKEHEEEKERIDRKVDARDENPDPITGEPGAHPIGVAAGGSGGAVAGATIGAAVGGPIGAAIGGAIGAVAGGAVGKAAGEALNPTLEEEYWKENYRNRPYFREGMDYSQYAPAYRYGWESAAKEAYRSRTFEEVEQNLQRDWEADRTSYPRPWSEIREATRDAYNRTRERFTGSASGRREGIWDDIEGNWMEFKGMIKEKWNRLTDDEIEEMEGRREKIIGQIRKKYGSEWSEHDIENELSSLNRSSR
jgi:uncharacterized protein YjbJ (UPF0337 family)